MAPAVDPATPTTSDARAIGCARTVGGSSLGAAGTTDPRPSGSTGQRCRCGDAVFGRSWPVAADPPAIGRPGSDPAGEGPRACPAAAVVAADRASRRCCLGAARKRRTRVPDRLLRRAADRVPSLGGHQPGSAGAAMTGKPVSVRRVPDVQFSGPMKGAASKLVPPRSGSGGPRSGAGSGGPGANGSAVRESTGDRVRAERPAREGRSVRRGHGRGTADPSFSPPAPSPEHAVSARPPLARCPPGGAAFRAEAARAGEPFALADPRPTFARGGPDRRQRRLTCWIWIPVARDGGIGRGRRQDRLRPAPVIGRVDGNHPDGNADIAGQVLPRAAQDRSAAGAGTVQARQAGRAQAAPTGAAQLYQQSASGNRRRPLSTNGLSHLRPARSRNRQPPGPVTEARSASPVAETPTTIDRSGPPANQPTPRTPTTISRRLDPSGAADPPRWRSTSAEPATRGRTSRPPRFRGPGISRRRLCRVPSSHQLRSPGVTATRCCAEPPPRPVILGVPLLPLHWNPAARNDFRKQ